MTKHELRQKLMEEMATRGEELNNYETVVSEYLLAAVKFAIVIAHVNQEQSTKRKRKTVNRAVNRDSTK